MWLTSTQIMESKFVVVILLNLYSQTRRTSFFPGQIYEKKERRWDLRRSRNELSFYLFFLLLCSVWLTNVDTSPPVQPWRLLLLLINLFFLQTLDYWRSPFSELLSARVQSTRGASGRGATSRFHLDFIHVLKYLTLGAAREYLYIFHEWEMPGSVRGVCVAAAAVAAPALRDHSSMNKALAVFNFQRCQPDLSRAGS